MRGMQNKKNIKNSKKCFIFCIKFKKSPFFMRNQKKMSTFVPRKSPVVISDKPGIQNQTSFFNYH